MRKLDYMLGSLVMRWLLLLKDIEESENVSANPEKPPRLSMGTKRSAGKSIRFRLKSGTCVTPQRLYVEPLLSDILKEGGDIVHTVEGERWMKF
jgi:hypothetical protein